MFTALTRADENCRRAWTPLSNPVAISHFDNIAINLTNYCPVQCSFCFIKADPDKRRSVVLSEEALDRTLRYAKEKRMRRIDVSGGEALSEMELTLKILREAEVESLSITTSGYFAVSNEKTRRVLDALADVLIERREAGRKKVETRIHLSVDEFHSRVPLDCVKRIIEAFDRGGDRRYAEMVLELRGILMVGDPIPKLIEDLGGTIENDDEGEFFPTMSISLPSGYRFTVHYGEMKLLDDMLGTVLAEKKFDKVYVDRLEAEPVFIGKGKQGGVSLDVSYNGVVTLQEFLAKDLILGDANEEGCFQTVDDRLRSDPLVVALREIGLHAVLEIASRLRPDIRRRSIEANNMFLAVSDIVRDDACREFVYRELKTLIEPADKATREQA